MDMRGTTRIGRRRIAFKTVAACSGADRCAMCVVVLAMRSGEPELDGRLRYRTAVPRGSDHTLQHISSSYARTYGCMGFIKGTEHVGFSGPAWCGRGYSGSKRSQQEAGNKRQKFCSVRAHTRSISPQLEYGRERLRLASESRDPFSLNNPTSSIFLFRLAHVLSRMNDVPFKEVQQA